MHRYRFALPVLLVALLVASPAVAQSGGLGRVEFPNSGAVEAQDAFIRGLLLLHSFEYEDAAEAFREAQQIDPDFAMAYWGEAMTYNHPIWQQQDREAALAALDRLGATPEERYSKTGSEREVAWLRTLEVLYGEGDKRERDHAYATALGELAETWPDDDEAHAFHALAILGTCHDGRDFVRYMQAAAIVEEVYERNPEHPGALHYLIHSYDDPIHAPLGLRAAELYSEVAARASHALHMPTHIFFALGMWDEAVELNEQSWQASLERRERKGLGAEARGYHARIWQHYAMLQQGRHGAAREMLAELAADLGGEAGGPRLRGAVTSMRAQAVVAGDLASAEIAADIEASGGRDVTDAYADLVAALARGDRASAEAAAGRVEAALNERDDPGAPSETRIVWLESRAHLAAADGDVDTALGMLAEAAEIEDATPFMFGPPGPVKPAHEAMGDVLSSAGRHEEALEHYRRALERTPGRSLTLLGIARSATELGRLDLAMRTYEELAAHWDEADSDRPELQEIRGGGATSEAGAR